MSVRGRAEPRTIIIPCIFIELSSLNHFFLHNRCLSGPYLWKYLRDWNKTWFVDRWQWEKELCTITIILPFIFTELSPINHLLFHNGRMPVGPISSVWLQLLPFIDNRLLGSIPHFQQVPCLYSKLNSEMTLVYPNDCR